MDRIGQLWATHKKPENSSIYVVMETLPRGVDRYQHEIAVFTQGRFVKTLYAHEGPGSWDSYIQLVQIA